MQTCCGTCPLDRRDEDRLLARSPLGYLLRILPSLLQNMTMFYQLSGFLIDCQVAFDAVELGFVGIFWNRASGCIVYVLWYVSQQLGQLTKCQCRNHEVVGSIPYWGIFIDLM